MESPDTKRDSDLPSPSNSAKDFPRLEPTAELRDSLHKNGGLSSSSAPWYSRRTYPGALLFNFGVFLLPAVYGTLSKLWIANIDSSLVVTTDTYAYVGIIVECFNEGLPRAAWSTIANYSTNSLARRISLTRTLIIVQAIIGLVLSLAFMGAADQFVSNFVPGPVQAVSVRYVRISAFGSCLASTVEIAVSGGTRALDKPDVPLAISVVKTLLQIILELIFISTVHVGGVRPTIEKQAWIRLVCDLGGACVGLVYFVFLARRMLRDSKLPIEDAKPSLSSLKILLRPGASTFTESAVRNAIYLFLVHTVILQGQAYATAWGVFNTIRWGLIMVPVQALEATSNVFVGHQWGRFQRLRLDTKHLPASWRDAFFVTKPALVSAAIALAIEVPMCLILSFAAVKPFARYLGGSSEVAAITEHMWKTIDWCYILYAVSTCFATVLLATKPSWYLGQSLIANLGYCLPWAIVLSQIKVTEGSAWTYHALVFGGSMVVSFIVMLVVNSVWALRLGAGKLG